MLGILSACGNITFGDDLVRDADAEVGLDSGVAPVPIDTGVRPDVGLTDTGVPEDDGGEGPCLPVTLPPTPSSWPFDTDRATYEGVFWTWANSQQFACSSGACHGGDEAPRIPTGANLEAEYGRGIDELWSYLNAEADRYSGRLWRHHPQYSGPSGQAAPDYSADQIVFLQELVHSVWACAAAPAIERQDAGPNCGAPPTPPADGGAPDDGADGGAPADGGGGTLPCYCDLPDVGPLGTTYCTQ